MMRLMVTLMSLVLVAGQTVFVSAKGKGPGIIGPQTERASPHEYPFLAVLRYRGNFFCGGSLIERDVVLTAAHCVIGKRLVYRVWDIELGRYARDGFSETVQYMKVSKIEVYPFYGRNVAGAYKNDVALIFLTTKAKLNKYVQLIDTLAVYGENEEIKQSTRCYITGYGQTDINGEIESPQYPNKLNTNIGKYKECQRVIKETFPGDPLYYMNPRKEVCVFEEDGSSGCYGDSGSPLFCDLKDNGKYVQYGVVSWGPNCKNQVSMFARVSYYRKWIKHKIAAWRKTMKSTPYNTLSA